MRLKDLAARVSLPWLILAVAMVAVIWGNSLVPGTGSSGISLTVMEAAHDVLRALGLPCEWLTNFIVRKTAHFTEYAVLGILVSQALDPRHAVDVRALGLTALICVLVPSIDETIQLFVSGRSGQVTDVLLDCCGAATGILLRSLIVHLSNGDGSKPVQ